MDRKNNHKKRERKEINLEKISRENPFSVPENYFEGLSQQILSKANKPETKVIPLWKRQDLRISMAAAAAILAIFFSVTFLWQHNENGMMAFEEEYLEDQMIWYANYQPDMFYEIIADNDEISELDYQEDSYIIDYIEDYSNYFLYEPEDIIAD